MEQSLARPIETTTVTNHHRDINHLIIVCCHAIYLGPPSSSTAQSPPSIEAFAPNELPSSNEANWLIEPFQTGETATYVEHIEAGVQALTADERAVLVFSGGATKPQISDKTEADGYLNVALEHGLFASTDPSLGQRIFVDRFATDSYQNILFSLIQFPLFVQELQRHTNNTSQPMRFPDKISIVSHDFKRTRFLDLHLPALRWHREAAFIGINPPFDPVKMMEIEEGDRLRGFGAWKKDIYGSGAALAQKRRARGWNEDEFKAQVLTRLPVGTVREQIENFVARRNDGQNLTKVYEGQLPWS